MAAAAVPYIIAAVSAAVAAGATVYSETQQAKAAKNQAKMQAEQDMFNARNAEMNAGLQQEAAAREAERVRGAQRRAIAGQTTAAAKSGLMISGSVIDVMADTQTESNKDIALALYQGDLNAYAYQQDALSYRLDAERAIWAGNEAARAHKTAAWIGGITGLAEIGASWAEGKAAKLRADGQRQTIPAQKRAVGVNLGVYESGTSRSRIAPSFTGTYGQWG